MAKDQTLGYYSAHPEKRVELILLQDAKSANEELARKAQNQLLIENEGFLKSTVSQWLKGNPFCDFAAVMQEARFAFLKAIQGFDISSGVSIRTYARYKLKKVKEIAFKTKPIQIIEVLETDASFVMRDPDWVDFDLKATLEDALDAALKPAEQEILYMHFFEGIKQCEIAKAKGYSKMRVSAVIKRGLPKVKKHLMQQGFNPSFFEQN